MRTNSQLKEELRRGAGGVAWRRDGPGRPYRARRSCELVRAAPTMAFMAATVSSET